MPDAFDAQHPEIKRALEADQAAAARVSWSTTDADPL